MDEETEAQSGQEQMIMMKMVTVTEHSGSPKKRFEGIPWWSSG